MSAKESFHQMSRLTRAAAQMDAGATSEETVRSAFISLIKIGGATVPAFLADVLHSQHGDACAAVAWRAVVARGVAITPEGTANTVYAPFADYCMYRGRIDVLREIVLRGVSQSMPADLRCANRSQLLDLMCVSRMNAGSSALSGYQLGLVGSAAMSYRDCSHAGEGLALAWEIDPKHLGFSVLAEEASERGAFVRSFLMARGISEIDTAANDATVTSPARARRTL